MQPPAPGRGRAGVTAWVDDGQCVTRALVEARTDVTDAMRARTISTCTRLSKRFEAMPSAQPNSAKVHPTSGAVP